VWSGGKDLAVGGRGAESERWRFFSRPPDALVKSHAFMVEGMEEGILVVLESDDVVALQSQNLV